MRFSLVTGGSSTTMDIAEQVETEASTILGQSAEKELPHLMMFQPTQITTNQHQF